jgi:putative Tad-like protein involved in Flp pilus assembly/von Willebrand factor type A domain-containing protein
MYAHPCDQARGRKRQSDRKGAIVVLAVLLMVIMLGMVAYAVDVGYIVNTKTELRRAVDSGALAGAGELPNGLAATEAIVRQFVKANRVGSRDVRDDEITVELGSWDGSGQRFLASGDKPSALRVVVVRQQQPLFFARIFGRDHFDLQEEAVAQVQPRDIMLTLDFSASMNDDSTFAARGTLGQAHIEANLLQIYNELGKPKYGNMTFTPKSISSTTNSTIKTTLGLNGVAYPYPVGSWDEFINHVKNNADLNKAGYTKKYGYMTLIHYWLVDRPMHSETPALAQVSAQPVDALKDSVRVFLSFMRSQQTNDRLGLSIYNSANETAVLESPLTETYESLDAIMANRQAGHYNHYTNIGAGMQKSRIELQNRGRSGAFKMLVLMTDGIANRPTNEATAKQFVLNEANACKSAKIPVVTISMGAGADVALMQKVADITGGVHFNIPGGQTGDEYEEDLLDVFGKIASGRPLHLVK